LIVLEAARLIDGTGAPAVERAAVHVDGSRITFAGRVADAPPCPPASPRIDLADRTILPGLIDCHAHPIMPFFPEDPAQVFTWPDEVKLLAAVGALDRALRSGVTTLRDCGAPHGTAFRLREAMDIGLVQGPRLVMAGRMVCPTGGHGYPHGGEADGPDGVRRVVRELFKEGADFIKVTATGGGTPRTPRHRATFTVKELAAAAQEAEGHDTYATAHCHGIEGMQRCLDAGIQMLEHATFVGMDGLEHFDRDLALRILDQDVTVVPTLQVHGRWVQERKDRVSELSAADKAVWPHRGDSFERRLDLVAQLDQLGVRLLMGSDSAWRTGPIDDLAFGLELHVQAGISPMKTIVSATGLAAERIGIGETAGTLEAGKEADIIAVEGDPLADIGAMGKVQMVMRAGRVVVGPVATGDSSLHAQNDRD
jgi:imidazolonepropionase-like amidohydrolase